MKSISRRFFGSFEQNYFVPPRYFMLTYKLNPTVLQTKVFDNPKGQELTEEHRAKVKLAVESSKIVFRGEVLPGTTRSSKQASAKPSTSEQVSDDVSKLSEVFFVFNGRDERDPHGFIQDDPLFREGIVDKGEIKEIDFIHKERDDELVISGKYK